jgi:hypothetical protein
MTRMLFIMHHIALCTTCNALVNGSHLLHMWVDHTETESEFQAEPVIVSQNPPTSVDRQHESQEARSLYPSALQLARALRLNFIGRAT